ncbi:cerebral cavernous malformations protein 2 [Biomphalaria glabrata]|uniref:Cerebral cavernous malformations protein 2 homolog n=2 Tax=Biomphalaria glabrata TaxID=6526 RepID=A0A9W3AB97_BIOGL|nr:cerebral cavernous malformations protein 2 homolog [Biomphalaria glabrata]KAI8749718.1 putative cerebral cavernous malformations protein 2; partial [Biomphalaria glabrata]KAI8786992.1 cerebral cavernous malformations protein 2 [Biomphalaria glabrata]
MDNDLRHKPSPPRRVDLPSSSNINYYNPVKHQNLIDDPVEIKPVQYAGEIEGVSPHLDITNRTDVLRIIDKGKKQGFIPAHVTGERVAILSLSIFNIKISKYNATEDLLLRIPMHEIAATCYIKDDKEHILAIKFGTPESCKLAVLYCDSKPIAEEICSLVGQCFNLVYTEALFRLLDRPLSSAEQHAQHPGSDGSGSGTIENVPVPPSPFTRGPRSESGNSKASDTGTGKELLEDYMNKLKAKLDADELRKFLQLLNDWKKDNNFIVFCDKFLALLGSDRKQLLSELVPFIPDHNYQYFEEFLLKNDIQQLDASSTLSSSGNNLHYPTRRSFSGVSTASSVSNNAVGADALENFLDFANTQFDSVDVDIDPKAYVPSEDY